MGQSQSDSNDSRIRRVQTNPLSADILSAGGSTDGRRFSTRPQLTPSSETTVRSFSLTRRRKAVQKRLSSIVKPKLELEATSSRARVNEGSQLARTDIPEASGHRSAWRRSLRFVKSRRWNKVSDHNKDDGGERISISNSDATLPISISPPQSSSFNSTVSIPACSSDSATTSQPPETSVPNPDTAILGSADIPTILTPALSVPPFSGEESNTNPLAIPSESIAALSTPHAAGEMETTDQIAVATAENPIVVASNANSGAISENVTVLLEPNSTSTATTTVPVSPARPQFPPSGTLVVVQGVVHTSDVQMSTETSAPFLSQTQNYNPNPTPPSSVIAEAPQTTDDFRTVQRVPSSVSSGHRGRLSALLRRTHRSPSSSRARSVSSALDSSSTHSANEASADIRQSQTSDAADVQSSTLYPPSPSPPVIQRGNPSGTISSSSIDVLGTLLSVAAAATAASLLTGSSDSASSTGLAYPSLVTTGTPSSTSIPGANTPALGVPSSLEFSSPYPSTSRRPLSTQINTTNTESVGARDRAERISQLWSAVRSRLGIGHGQPSSQRTDPDSQPFTNPIDSDASADAAAVDARGGPGAGPVMDAHNARERMLNEISRAFNLGFSSPSSSAPPTNFTTDAGDTSQGPTIGRAERGNSDSGLPSEGTFERFLLDLQVDLRNVLTGEGDRRTTREREEPTIPEANNSLTSQDERLPRPLREPEPEDDTEEDSIPSLQDVSDSDDDTESNNSHASSSDSFASVSPADEAAQHRFDVSESPNDPSIPRPRINYWRLHRFPPIPAARAHAAADNVAQNMRSGLGGLTRAATLGSTPAPRSVTSIAGEDSGTGATPSLSRNSVVQDSPNTGSANVVPVVIVGLQSVSPFWATEPITTPRNLMNQSPVPSRADNAIRSTPTPTTGTMLQDTGSSASSSTSPVGMTSQGTQTQTSNTTPRDIGIPIPSPDSRTFLIYVIGGYYPPDHEIVTGTGENGVLDSSFEALLLLNELLHRAPFETPITVTKEQLNKSGLEIINGGQMQEWVKAGKVRSNCVEQCLICLEEYDKQDSVRVLECKHAFHMDCVDRWLLEGRNSCPACRGKGVSEGSEARSS
ncbi:hypothetical protein C8R41DRAFT_244194 [Lentinula lateritia]|uniref:RING-type domain-containing protein n=1 Tax=Lentinula lateritia TaxID=40482 RepID=A0ABQ8VR00_9AGAR|nr:hypothetical protein C8R41DRAFT_244194 [Lentinula lateritia]